MDTFILDRKNLELVLDNLRDGIIAHDMERRILFFNKEAEKITGYSKKDVLGKDCHLVFEAPFCGERCSFCSSESLPDFNRKIEYPVAITTKDGEIRRIEMCVTGIMDKGVLKGVIASFRDMTEHDALLARAQEMTSFSGIIGRDREMLHLFQQIRDVAPYDYPVHINGETGTGKERVAAALHNESKRAGALFVPVNCGAIPEGLVESELFGHVKGAFSGAVKERKGRCELAHRGTLFLDEVAELPKQVQVKLLRFLQEGSLERVGGEKSIKVDVRIISATNKDLAEEVKKGTFRKDLYYRLNVIPITLPPLRDRKNDIPLLVSHFLEVARDDHEDAIPEFSKEALSIMMDYSWPGNVRELQNAVQFAIVRCKQEKIMPSDLPMELLNMVLEHNGGNNDTPHSRSDRGAGSASHGKLDRNSVKNALEITGGNKARAARYLGVGRATLYRFLDRFPDAGDIEVYRY
ncbi:Sigma-54 dependent sensory box histidine kinase/response regulator [Desulfamplus magnetovallimortis]|uniref:Sigma-54 dependent sensory box histidine kinase/response regulator n=1 Tax=Desulfamplus magnetovallimortis TaxID=1246637 RepID=A0A1W1H7N7_9BACT|nr:sigma 54-interacting transcriptional regulator [Desulfamplus magnetovallimortis]SLM28500.1 Sigma-54 dependent sensory box histidine kinase/response regulator [Desulfamplus magnetovallimortis]